MLMFLTLQQEIFKFEDGKLQLLPINTDARKQQLFHNVCCNLYLLLYSFNDKRPSLSMSPISIYSCTLEEKEILVKNIELNILIDYFLKGAFQGQWKQKIQRNITWLKIPIGETDQLFTRIPKS